ncbi:carboxypeptidase Y precursor [Metarhizium album ARSEF 1941]|uniref:Carboxypeptidase n=1 Tax=Metarhizium album (strain ARSEF 1941) TaxID=1081103 RepID=A0A0B2WZA5_METAS|nr:carboxypeptidase Y precursor [Metarhizium album ARSEF 1941]KHN99363.1 carboxypeptidase Y precursor [Metarhizium album ARSEF 1941]
MHLFTAFSLGLAFVVTASPGPPSPNTAGVPVSSRSFRRSDSEWSHIIDGSDVKASKNYGGRLVDYKLRARAVDPSRLGVDKVRQFSGYLDDNSTDKHLFYWFFESRSDPKNDPVILWLTGGPGCSSMSGLFMELGPSMVDQNGSLHANPYSWNSNASVIFLDQPVNTGFSYSKAEVDTTAAAARDIYALMTLFFEQFPQYAKQDFHIAGESYAGHYIPATAYEILSHSRRNINLKSVLIGNGLTDPYTQYGYYEAMACGKGGHKAVLDQQTCEGMRKALPQCRSAIEACYGGNHYACVDSAAYCDGPFLASYLKTNLNPYDVRKKCVGGSLCYKEANYAQQWLNRKDVMQTLGVEVRTFDTCNPQINLAFRQAGDWFLPIQRYVPHILAQIPVLIYAGDVDFICNWLGNEAWTNALPWPGKDAFNSAGPLELTARSGKNYAKIKHAQGFAFARVYQAGHLVPHDEPEGALDLMTRWIRGEWSK